MRGKALHAVENAINLRITPAYAGKRLQIKFLNCMNKDHPRLCGEKPLHVQFWTCNTGSPPPMRGKVKFCSTIFSDFWITPAYAGKSNGFI